MKIPTRNEYYAILGAFIALFGLFLLFVTFMQWVELPSLTMLSGGGTIFFLGFGLTGAGVATVLTAWSGLKS